MTTRMIFTYTIHLCFFCYTILLFLRIVSSWLPDQWRNHRLVHFLAFYTDPFLNIFRRLLPPIGGTLDLSPIFAFLALKILEVLLLRMVG